MAAISATLDQPEHLGKIDRPLANSQMLLNCAAAVRDTHPAAASQIHPGKKSGDAFRQQMGVVDGEGPAQATPSASANSE